MYAPTRVTRLLPVTGATIPVWQMAGLGFALLTMGILLILGAKKSDNPVVRKLLLAMLATAIVLASMVMFNFYGMGYALAFLALAFVMGTWASAGNLLPRLAFEPYMKRDGDYVWCLTKNGLPVASKHR